MLTLSGKNNLYSILPADEKKSIFMLCGKADSHSRPPIALRSGDTIACGKSEFKVVFQQRGNRELQGSPDATAELRSRLKAFNYELRVRNGRQQQHLVVEQSTEVAEASQQDLGGDDADSATSQFKNLNRQAKEVSSNFAASNVLFQDLNALLEHFEVSDFGNGPIMILLTVRGPKAKQFFLCDPLETTIGSSSHASISISNDKRITPYHCRVYFDPILQRWMLEDLQSTHGTFVKVDEPTIVSTGDVFVMGMTLVRILGTQIPAHQHQQGSGRCAQM